MLFLAWQVAARGVSFRSPGVALGLLDGANFVFHEAGHVLFLFFGQTLHVLGGSLTQVAIPLACTLSFWWRRRYAAAAAALFWAGESVTHVAIYIADARAMALPLHGGPGVIHDWNYLLTRAGLVQWAPGLGQAVGGLGLVAILGALGLLALDLLRVLANPGQPDADPVSTDPPRGG
ncbi:MAG: hypothetical protein ACREK6_00800 [Candidatus Rokuibacteriota bacterium]